MCLVFSLVHSTTRTVPGAILEKLDGKTKLITGILKLQVHLDAPPQLLKTLTQYDSLIHQMNTAIWNLNNFAFINSQSKGSPIDDLMSMCTQELVSLQAQVEKVKALPWMRTRQTRGLIDAGGLLLSSVFGLATEGQVTTVTRQVNLVTSAMHHSNVAILDIQHDQKSLSSEMAEVQRQVNQLNQYARQNSQVTTVMHKLIVLKMQMDKISSFFNFVSQIDRDMFHLLASAKHSDNPALPRLLFPLSLFRPYVDETEQLLNLKSAIPLTSENFNSFLSVVRAYANGQAYSLMLIVPFTDNAVYHMYRFHQLPTFARQHNISRIVLRLKNPYFILKSTLDSVAVLAESEYKMCMTSFIRETLRLCVKHHISFKIPLNSVATPPEIICMESIIRFNNIGPCRYDEVGSTGVYRAVVNNRLYISFDRATEAILNCKNGSARAILLPLTILAPSCSISTDALSIKALAIVHDNTTIGVHDPSLPLEQIIDSTVHFPSGPVDERPVVRTQLHEAIVRKHVNLSDALLRQVTHVNKKNTAFLTAFSFTTLFILGAGIYAIFKVRRLLGGSRSIQVATPETRRLYPKIDEPELVIPTEVGTRTPATPHKGPLREQRWSVADIPMTNVANWKKRLIL